MMTAWARLFGGSGGVPTRDRPEVRANALRLLVDVPHDYSAARDLLRRLRDVGE